METFSADIQLVWDNILQVTRDGAAVTYTTMTSTARSSGLQGPCDESFRDACGISSINVNIDGKNFQTADVSTIMESICHYYPEELSALF
jgi:hypothetical protein